MQGLEGYHITRVACGSSHSVAWATTDTSSPTSHEPVMFQVEKDPLGAALIGLFLRFPPCTTICNVICLRLVEVTINHKPSFSHAYIQSSSQYIHTPIHLRLVIAQFYFVHSLCA